MCAGPKYEYFWADGNKIKKPIKVSAPKYVDLLMSWIDQDQNRRKTFSRRALTSLSPKISKTLSRTYSEDYSECTRISTIPISTKLSHLGKKPINTCFKHFYLFIKEFSLVKKEELEPLKDLIDSLKLDEQ